MGRLFASLMMVSLLVGCAGVEKKAELTNSAVGAVLAAGPGDTVMDFRVTRPLPNAFGKADIFGRTTNAGRIVVRYLGSQDTKAIFERADVLIETNATTMNQTPLFVPQTSQTSVSGMVGTTPVYGTGTSTSYSVVGPRPTTEHAMASQPIQIPLEAGQNIRIEGRTLTVIQVSPGSVSYRID